jgi:integrase
MISFIEEKAIKVVGLVVERRIEIVEDFTLLIPASFDAPDGVLPIAVIDEQHTLPSEIFNLRRSDVDFERNVLRAGTKTNEEREIPMGTAVREVLLELYNRDTGSEYLFVSWRTGDRFKEIKNGFRRALELAGIKGACLYTMRHTFGTRLGEKGYSAYEVMALMGHRDIKTSSRYVHSTDGRKRAAVESIWESSPHKIPTNGEQPTL